MFVVDDLSARCNQFYKNTLLNDEREKCDVVCNNDIVCKEDVGAFRNSDIERDVCFDVNGRDLKIEKISLKGNKLYITFDGYSNVDYKEEKSFFRTSCKSVFNISYNVLKYSVKSVYSVVCFSCDHPVFVSLCGYSLYNFLPSNFQELICVALDKVLISARGVFANILKDAVKISYRGSLGILSGIFSGLF